jgi:hypothetical protein
MRSRLISSLYLALGLFPWNQCFAQGTNPEDLDIPDEAVIAEPAPAKEAVPSTAPTNQSTPDQPAPATVAPAAPPPASTPGQDVVTIPRAVWEQLLRDVEELKRARGATQPSTTPTPSTEPPAATSSGETPPPLEAEVTPATGSNRSLLLPDISLIVTGKGFLSNDRQDPDRNRMFLDEAELGIQGYVYPNVKADAYIVAAPSEDEPFDIEEGYLTFLSLRKNLNLVVGRKFAPFGRTGEQHPHSWLYSRQLIPRRNLIAEENLVGDGVLARFLLPTGKNLFANLDVGYWQAGGGHTHDEEEGEGFPRGPGAGFNDNFYSARLWLGRSFGRNSELEIGGSYARGKSEAEAEHEGEEGEEEEHEVSRGRVALTGVDLTYRRYLSNDRRLLLRGEYFRYKPSGGLESNRATGYYLLGNYRLDKRNDVGLLYEKSELPLFPGDHEKAWSLIYTRQFSESFYLRLHGTHGSRPGKGSYNEAYVQLTWGIGPHTHELE